jgi:hypothetical protein
LAAMQDLLNPQPRLGLDGRPVASSTHMTRAGAETLVLRTGLDDCSGIELQSVYTGHMFAAESQVTHLLLARDAHEVESRTVAHHDLPVVYARERCLYDHLIRLQDFVAALGRGRLQIDLVDATLASIGRG